MYRVKLYKLNAQGHWDDKGTGHVAVEFLPVRNSRMRVALDAGALSALV
jgi:hypothetical protein